MGYTGRGPYLDNAHSTKGRKKVIHAQKPTHASHHRRQTLPVRMAEAYGVGAAEMTWE